MRSAVLASSTFSTSTHNMSLKPGFNDYDSSEEQGCSSSSPSKALADLDSQTVPPLNHLSKSVRTFLQPKESPNSRKHRLNFEPSHRPLESIQEEILADSSTSPKFQEYQSASLRTESTFIIPGGTQLTRKPKPKFVRRLFSYFLVCYFVVIFRGCFLLLCNLWPLPADDKHSYIVPKNKKYL